MLLGPGCSDWLGLLPGLVPGDQQGREPTDDRKATDDHERVEVLPAAGYGAGDQGAGDRHTQRGAEVGDTARYAGDIALDTFRPGRLHEIDRRGEHDPDPDAHQEQAGDVAPDAGIFAAER